MEVRRLAPDSAHLRRHQPTSDDTRPKGPQMLQKIRQLLDFEVTIGQLLVIGLVLGTPYLLVGTVWSATHTQHLNQMHGADMTVSFLGSIVSWPVLLFSNVCMT
jgi:hypothetical protein